MPSELWKSFIFGSLASQQGNSEISETRSSSKMGESRGLRHNGTWQSRLQGVAPMLSMVYLYLREPV